MHEVYRKKDNGRYEYLEDGVKTLNKGDKFKIKNPDTGHLYEAENGATVFKCINGPRIDEDTGEWMVDVAM